MSKEAESIAELPDTVDLDDVAVTVEVDGVEVEGEWVDVQGDGEEDGELPALFVPAAGAFMPGQRVTVAGLGYGRVVSQDPITRQVQVAFEPGRGWYAASRVQHAGEGE